MPTTTRRLRHAPTRQHRLPGRGRVLLTLFWALLVVGVVATAAPAGMALSDAASPRLQSGEQIAARLAPQPGPRHDALRPDRALEHTLRLRHARAANENSRSDQGPEKTELPATVAPSAARHRRRVDIGDAAVSTALPRSKRQHHPRDPPRLA